MVAGAAKNEISYDDIISDITELFLSGEKIERNPESLGSSSKSLTTLMWNLGNWRRGMNWRLPSVVDEDKIYYKEHRKEKFPDHVEENNNLFLQMLKNLRAHIMLVCEAGTLEPHQKYLQDHGFVLTMQKTYVFWPDWERTAALSKLEVQKMTMSGVRTKQEDQLWYF